MNQVPITYASVASGIEAATVAWHPLGFSPVWFSEIAPFPCKFLAYRYPHVPNLGDMLKITEHETFKTTDFTVLVGGTPCQSFSIAGLRKGLSDHRGNLALEFCRILQLKRPSWFVWENVPGVLSSFSDDPDHLYLPDEEREQTSDFATLLTAFSQCGYSCAWRVLDAQYAGVPQRRQRIFVVGYLGADWRPPAAVLFDGPGIPGDFTPGKKKKEEITGPLDARTNGGGGTGTDGACAGQIVSTLDASYARLQGASGQDLNHGHSTLVAFGGNNCSGAIDVAASLKASSSKIDFESENFIVSSTLCSTQGRTRGSGIDPGLLAPGTPQIFVQNTRDEVRFMGVDGSITGALTSDVGMKQQHYLLEPIAGVRRLTPLEWERLQGFEDNYTLIPGASDTARYRAIGNSMAVPVMGWIGQRLKHVHEAIESLK